MQSGAFYHANAIPARTLCTRDQDIWGAGGSSKIAKSCLTSKHWDQFPREWDFSRVYGGMLSCLSKTASATVALPRRVPWWDTGSDPPIFVHDILPTQVCAPHIALRIKGTGAFEPGVCKPCNLAVLHVHRMSNKYCTGQEVLPLIPHWHPSQHYLTLGRPYIVFVWPAGLLPCCCTCDDLWRVLSKQCRKRLDAAWAHSFRRLA